LFIYLRTELNSQWPITESVRIQTAIRQRKDKTHTKKERKIDQLRYSHLNMSYLTQGQWLEEHVNMVKLRMFQVGTRMPTVSRTEGQHLAALKTFIRSKASKWRRLLSTVSKFNLSNKLSQWYSTSWNTLLWQKAANFLRIRSSLLESVIGTEFQAKYGTSWQSKVGNKNVIVRISPSNFSAREKRISTWWRKLSLQSICKPNP
jgi:hypothetical protein